jgi:uncharacterized Tic20 family protein
MKYGNPGWGAPFGNRRSTKVAGFVHFRVVDENKQNQPEEPPEPPSQPDPTPPPTPGVTVSSTPGPPLSDADSKLWAMLAHLLAIVGSFVAPLVIWLVFKDRSSFVDEHGKEALNFQIAVTIAGLASLVLTVVCIGYFLGLAVAIADIVFCILAGLEAQKGNAYKYPVTLRLIK